MHLSPTPGTRQKGATLLEALMGILIFSVGILALVGMQALAIKQMTDAKYRSDAGFFRERDHRPHVGKPRQSRLL